MSEWANMFVEYYGAKFEDIVFMLTHIELPYVTGRQGSIAKPIISIASKRCTIEVNNIYTLRRA